ncbi:MAG UNVERIFIED_CONTAM: cyclic nucleotide-binding domain-containing protein [Planctomycetaceae bacterium]
MASERHDENQSFGDTPQLLQTALQRLFTNLPVDQLQPLLERVVFRRMEAGEILMAEGESATDLFVLLRAVAAGSTLRMPSGSLRLIETVETSGQLLGEQAFLEGRQFRSASVLMLEASEIAVLPGTEFRKLLSADTEAAEKLSSQAVRYALNKLGVLATELRHIADPSAAMQGTVRQFSAGSVIYRAGDEAGCAWFLLAGEVSLTALGSTQPSETIRAGLLFGQSEVLNREPRRETATAVVSAEVLTIDSAVLRSCQQRGGSWERF